MNSQKAKVIIIICKIAQKREKLHKEMKQRRWNHRKGDPKTQKYSKTKKKYKNTRKIVHNSLYITKT